MQESPHEREGIDDFSFLVGLVCLFALMCVANSAEALPLVMDCESTDPIVSIVTWTANAGWAGLAYACLFRSSRITGRGLAFVLTLGVCGMAVSVFALVAGQLSPGTISILIVDLIGTWTLNGLGIVWIVDKVRRIRAASNTDEADATR